MTELCSS